MLPVNVLHSRPCKKQIQYRNPVNNVLKDVKYNLCSSQQRDQECRLGRKCRKCRKCRKHEDKKVRSVRGLGSPHGMGGVLTSSHGTARTAIGKTFSFRYLLTLAPRRLFFSFSSYLCIFFCPVCLDGLFPFH